MERRYRYSGLIGLAAVLAAFLLIVLLTGSGTLCFTRTLTGLPCPGCGLTTAAKSLLHGEISASLKYHPLWPAVVVAAAVYLFRNRIKICGKLHNGKYFYISLLVAFLALFVVRLLLYFPNGPYPMVITNHSLYHTITNLFTRYL